MTHKSMIIRYVISFIIPYILTYSLYIHFNGDVSPGGGFQAGAIFATAVVAYDMIFVIKVQDRVLVDILVILATLGVAIIICVGLISIFFDMNYMNYDYLNRDKHLAQHLGIFIFENGVGVTVSSVLSLIYLLLKELYN